jgi:hypothetical protein
MRPYLEKDYHRKIAGGVAQGIVPEFKPSTAKKKKKRKKKKWQGNFDQRKPTTLIIGIIILEAISRPCSPTQYPMSK